MRSRLVFGAVSLGALVSLASCTCGRPVDGGDAGADAGAGVDGGAGTDGGMTDGGSGGDGGTCSGRVPAEHRPMGVTCPMSRPPGQFNPGGPGCQSDAECDAGINGRCESTMGGALINLCSYDECFTDSDCSGNLPCACRSRLDANVCSVGSDCRVDSDCGGCGYCSPSPPSMLACVSAFHCHTAHDQCLDAADCADAGGFMPRCGFDPASSAWRCASICLVQ